MTCKAAGPGSLDQSHLAEHQTSGHKDVLDVLDGLVSLAAKIQLSGNTAKTNTLKCRDTAVRVWSSLNADVIEKIKSNPAPWLLVPMQGVSSVLREIDRTIAKYRDMTKVLRFILGRSIRHEFERRWSDFDLTVTHLLDNVDALPKSPHAQQEEHPAQGIDVHVKEREAMNGVAKMGRKPKNGEMAIRDERQAYATALRPYQFTCEESLTGDHSFSQKSSTAASLERSKRLSREVRLLPTALPLHWDSCILLAVDRTRMDLMRAAIIPAENTPYANGIFVFDVYVPVDYPNGPPRVQFKTTAGGKIRFNPNLYKSGMVCLSLLGTWPGPSWGISSTILQLMVSIQGMVFVEDPWFNEPGRTARTRRALDESRSYNLSVRCHTLQHAILPAIKAPPQPFQKACREHFRIKQRSIRNQCEKWVEDAKGSTWESPTRKVSAEIHAALNRLK
ncbi:unnamed protein product [Ostreobium quekettii]|uniref:UBC core domain-containing protein n=1 Tax=Ostreobium quekettii TaxID=121088 RepID=A0A8S1JI38_9CHLO|nr:unnamed protein product [Ostreobium quekettii]|eukprot:evm.model.scf_89.26 EVM.evm.TU.scf_89.26   scf_89:144520-149110(-)